MTDVTIYHNPRCSKSRQTLQLLEAHKIKPTIIEYLKTPPTPAALKAILGKLGITSRELLRVKEADYATAGLDNLALSEDDVIAAMCQYPKLIERPIVVANQKAVIGRPPENILTIL